MQRGQKHTIKCRCILPQFKDLEDPPCHQFVVFSVVDDSTDAFSMHFVQCNNCGVVHKVTDLCRSEVMNGREDLSSVQTLDEIRSCLSEKILSTLDRHNADISTYQQAKWIVDNERWGEMVVLSSDVIDGMKQVKYMVILSQNMVKIDSAARDDAVRS